MKSSLKSNLNSRLEMEEEIIKERDARSIETDQCKRKKRKA